MSICKPCSSAGDRNRAIVDDDEKVKLVEHPKNCGCPCQHRDPSQWEDMYSSERPE